MTEQKLPSRGGSFVNDDVTGDLMPAPPPAAPAPDTPLPETPVVADRPQKKEAAK